MFSGGSPQSLVESEAGEVEEAQILLSDHTAEVVTVDTGTK